MEIWKRYEVSNLGRIKDNIRDRIFMPYAKLAKAFGIRQPLAVQIGKEKYWKEMA